MADRSTNINFSEHILDNGLNVILSADKTIPSIAINICYKVGSKDEEPDKRGFAHLFEHLMYEGSRNVPNGDYDKHCQMAGGENNGYTNEDKTNYFIVLPSHQLELGLWLESDRMLDFAITEQSLKRQKEVVLEEKKQVFDNKPYGSLSLEFPPRMYKKGGYSWDTIGVMEDIKAATLDDVKNFFNKYYVPNNAFLSITGDFEEDKTIKAVKKYFGEIKPGSVTRNNHFENYFNSGEIIDTIYDDIQLPGLFIGYRTTGENTDEQYALDIVADLLSSGESSRLYKSLVYEKQMCSEAGCYTDPKEFNGALYIYAILMPGIEIEDVKKEIDIILDELRNKGITESELQKVKNRIETRHAYRMQSIVSKADMLAHYRAFFGNAGYLNSVTGKYLSVSGSDVLNASNRFLTNENRVILQYLPADNHKNNQ